jgi:CheY-like chemotaxis protein
VTIDLSAIAASVCAPFEMKGGSTILLLENEEHDVFIFRRALSKLEFPGLVRVVPNVTQAKAYLVGTGEFQNRNYYPLPDFIVSDLKMHGETGLEFLHWLRQQPAFSEIPFFILSGSGLAEDQARALALGAKHYFTKTGDFPEAVERVRTLIDLAAKDAPRTQPSA